MRQNYGVILVVISFIFLIGGCANVINDYKASAINVKTIKEKYNKSGVKINIGSFTSNGPENKSIMCRLNGPITPPDGKSFESYIADALRSEVKFAGIYSDGSKISFNTHFEQISFNSTIGLGKWVIIAKFSTENNSNFKVESEYEFDAAFAAALACAQVSEAFPNAVEKFIDHTVSHPEFERIINGR